MVSLLRLDDEEERPPPSVQPGGRPGRSQMIGAGVALVALLSSAAVENLAAGSFGFARQDAVLAASGGPIQRAILDLLPGGVASPEDASGSLADSPVPH